MHPLPPDDLLQLQLFPLLFVILWLSISTLLAVLGGWISLAKHFRAEQPVRGERFRFVSGSMGSRVLPVSFGNCLSVVVGDAGFGLSMFFLFRLFSPPLLIPWGAVKSVESKRVLWSRYTVIRLHDHWPIISIRGAAGEGIRQAFERVGRRLKPSRLV